MMSNVRGMAICIGVTGVASILLWFYFKNRMETVENKLNSVFNMIQNFNDQPPPTIAYGDVKDQIEETQDPFLDNDLQYQNEMNSIQLPQEGNQSTQDLINVSENEDDNSEDDNSEDDNSEDDNSDDENSDHENSDHENSEDENDNKNILLKVLETVEHDEPVKKISLVEKEEDGDSLDDLSDDDDDDELSDDIKEEIQQEYSSMKVSELKKLAQTKGLSGYTKLNKAGLVNLLENN